MKTKMNVRTIVLMIVCVVLGVVFIKNGLESKQALQHTREQVITKPSITVTINNGFSVITDSVLAATPFEALSVVAQKNQVPLITKQYDFGVFVSGVGDVITTTDFGWIYYVNMKPGDVAADVYELKTGDQVEWKFEKSIY